MPMDFEESSNRIFRVDTTNALKMDAAGSYEELAKLRHTTRRHVPEDSNYLRWYSSEKVHVRFQAFTALCYYGTCFGMLALGRSTADVMVCFLSPSSQRETQRKINYKFFSCLSFTHHTPPPILQPLQKYKCSCLYTNYSLSPVSPTRLVFLSKHHLWYSWSCIFSSISVPAPYVACLHLHQL